MRILGVSPLLLFLLGCSVSIAPVVTPVQPGVYRGDILCTTDTIGPNNELLDQQTLTEPVTFEISPNGVLIVEGDEVRENRTVTLGTVQVTYTRVATTEIGIVIHATTTDLGVEAFSVATMDQQTATSLFYRITLTAIVGSTTQISDCEGLLEQ